MKYRKKTVIEKSQIKKIIKKNKSKNLKKLSRWKIICKIYFSMKIFQSSHIRKYSWKKKDYWMLMSEV